VKQFFFTVDEGKTYFPLDASTKAPVTHEGKIAYRAHVFSTDGGRTGWVAYVSKYSPISPEPLVRRPGETAWTPATSPGAAAILNVQPPKGVTAKAVEVFPK
jgi:hypothetical protein